MFCLLCVRGPVPSLRFCGEKSGYAGGSTPMVAISQFFDLQVIFLLAEIDGNTDKLPWAQMDSFPTPTLTSCWSLLPGVSPYILHSSKRAGLLLSRQKSAARAKSRLGFVPPSIVSSHHHYHKTGCQHVAQSMRNTEICSGPQIQVEEMLPWSQSQPLGQKENGGIQAVWHCVLVSMPETSWYHDFSKPCEVLGSLIH